jgi:hypothetical protein
MAKEVTSKVPFKPIERKKASEEEIQKGLELLAKQRHTSERVKAGELKGATGKKRADMTPEELKVTRDKNRRQNVHDRLLRQKAVAKGITVTPAEVDAYIKAHFPG